MQCAEESSAVAVSQTYICSSVVRHVHLSNRNTRCTKGLMLLVMHIAKYIHALTKARVRPCRSACVVARTATADSVPKLAKATVAMPLLFLSTICSQHYHYNNKDHCDRYQRQKSNMRSRLCIIRRVFGGSCNVGVLISGWEWRW